MICRADTMGVFQIESRAQMSMLPRLRPRMLLRPGDRGGDRSARADPGRHGASLPAAPQRPGAGQLIPTTRFASVLEKTLGVPLFQEQAMRLAVVAAGFTPGEADQLRRAMGAWRRPGVIEQFRQKLLDGMLAKGCRPSSPSSVFQQIRGFGEYGFPESHAASFALLVYVSAWLKHYYPAAFAAALLNSQPMGFYAPAQLVRDAREHGVEVRPVDVNHSDWDCTLELAGGRASRPPVAGELPRPAVRSETPEAIPPPDPPLTPPCQGGEFENPSPLRGEGRVRGETLLRPAARHAPAVRPAGGRGGTNRASARHAPVSLA